MIADAHVDLLMELAYRERRLGETNVFADTWLPLFERGGVGLQVCAVYVDVAVQPESALREACARSRITPSDTSRSTSSRPSRDRLPPSSAAPSANAFLRFHVSPAIRTPSAWKTSAGHVSTPKHSTPSASVWPG